jgi:hypothetical protein
MFGGELYVTSVSCSAPEGVPIREVFSGSYQEGEHRHFCIVRGFGVYANGERGGLRWTKFATHACAGLLHAPRILGLRWRWPLALSW